MAFRGRIVLYFTSFGQVSFVYFLRHEISKGRIVLESEYTGAVKKYLNEIVAFNASQFLSLRVKFEEKSASKGRWDPKLLDLHERDHTSDIGIMSGVECKFKSISFTFFGFHAVRWLSSLLTASLQLGDILIIFNALFEPIYNIIE